MTINEYTRELERLTSDEFSAFSKALGGSPCSKEELVKAFVEDPKQERRICQLLHLLTEEERIGRASVKSMWASWFSAAAAVLAILVAIWALWLSNSISREQLSLSVSPKIRVEPSDLVHGETGEFRLTIFNPGPSDLEDVRIYEDYFVSLTPPNGPTAFHRFGIFVTNPDSTISNLAGGETAPVTISFKEVHDEMDKFYLSDLIGHRMRIARLTIKGRRTVDGTEFAQSKVYIIAGDGNVLIDHDERGFVPVGPSYDEIKKSLGVMAE